MRDARAKRLSADRCLGGPHLSVSDSGLRPISLCAKLVLSSDAEKLISRPGTAIWLALVHNGCSGLISRRESQYREASEMAGRTTRAALVGLGRLGAPLAACLAAKGFAVVGVDVDPGKVDAVNQGRAPVFEPRLEELIGQNTSRLRASTNI